MKRAYALVGIGDKGKTETLNLLIDLLDVSTTNCPMPTPTPTGENRKRWFNYKGFIVGIGTAGDNGGEVKLNCKYFIKHNCDVVFTATRTKGGSMHEIIDFCNKNDFEIHWIGKHVVNSNFAEINILQAKELFDLIFQKVTST